MRNWTLKHDNLASLDSLQDCADLKRFDHLKHHSFSSGAHGKLEYDSDFLKNISLSNEDHFWLNSYVKEQSLQF